MKFLMLLALVMIVVPACGPKCKKAHDEQYTVPAYTYTTYDTYGVGKHAIQIPRLVTNPEHTEIRTVCDEYEAEK